MCIYVYMFMFIVFFFISVFFCSLHFFHIYNVYMYVVAIYMMSGCGYICMYEYNVHSIFLFIYVFSYMY